MTGCSSGHISSSSSSIDQKYLDEKAHIAFLGLPAVKQSSLQREDRMKFTHHYAQLKDVRLHYVTVGQGKPVLLIHGYPQTWYAWRKLMPLLANEYFLIAPDTRGLGDSSRPPDGYDKKQVANDLWRLMHDVLGHEKFIVIGHDWGAEAAFRLAADHPQNVTALVMLELPIFGEPLKTSLRILPMQWYVVFHQIPNLPEALTQGRERLYLEYFYAWDKAKGAIANGAINDIDVAEYVRTYSQPGAMRAGFNYYRNLKQDIEDNRATLANGFKLTMPCLGLGGGELSGWRDLAVNSLRRVCKSRVEGGVIPESGHFIPEEKPQELANWLKSFLAKP